MSESKIKPESRKIINITDINHFEREIIRNDDNLMVVLYITNWCEACIRFAPEYEILSNQFPTVKFFRIDLNKSADLAIRHGVTSLPTLMFYRGGVKLDYHTGSEKSQIESKIFLHLLSGTSSLLQPIDNATEPCIVTNFNPPSSTTGSVDAPNNTNIPPSSSTPISIIEPTSNTLKSQELLDINNFISYADCECLNESDLHNMEQMLKNNDAFLLSDSDEQLVLSITFNQSMKLQSIKIQAPEDTGPKEIKIFINQPRTIDFDSAEKMIPVQEFSLNSQDISKGNPINLFYVKFQNVQNIQIFIRNNQTSAEVTRIDKLNFIGCFVIKPTRAMLRISS